VAACSNASTGLARYLFRDRQHAASRAPLQGEGRLAVLHRGVLKVTAEFGWRLEAWAVFSNHYHFVAQSPELEDNAKSLKRMLSLLHETTSKWVNQLDHVPGRQVWFNFRETTLNLREVVSRPTQLHAPKRGKTRACAGG
jgi:REP element-mobilizing transposase RayT